MLATGWAHTLRYTYTARVWLLINAARTLSSFVPIYLVHGGPRFLPLAPSSFVPTITYPLWLSRHTMLLDLFPARAGSAAVGWLRSTVTVPLVVMVVVTDVFGVPGVVPRVTGILFHFIIHIHILVVGPIVPLVTLCTLI
jgi:hypothetical protein